MRILLLDSRRSLAKEDHQITKDFANWFTEMKCLFVQGQFNYKLVGEENFQYTWGLIFRILEKCKAIEHVQLRAAGWGLELPPILQPWPVLPKLRILDLHGIDRSWDSITSISSEVCLLDVLLSLQNKTDMDMKEDLTSNALW